MTDFEPVKKALAAGADPAMLCTTCPWDRNCVTPPSMTSADIDAKMAEATREDERKMAEAKMAGKDAGMPVGMLLTAISFGGRDTSATVCPVFALRLRSSGGRKIADGIRATMQGWGDDDA